MHGYDAYETIHLNCKDQDIRIGITTLGWDIYSHILKNVLNL